jgi:DNA-binding response OmpR family regulator
MDTALYVRAGRGGVEARPEQAVEADRKSALLLEGDEVMSKTACRMLAGAGYEVTCVRDGAAGLRAILSRDFDVILCDMFIPQLSGKVFYLAVQRIRPHLCRCFLFTTGHEADDEVRAFIDLIGGSMLWKPFTEHELEGALRAALERGRATWQ